MKRLALIRFCTRCLFSACLAVGTLGLLATPTAHATDLVVGDLANTFNSLASVNPGIGFAQRFDITVTTANLTMARLFLGNQDPVYPVTPLVQIRDGTGLGGGPGANVLGTLGVNPGDIPSYVFGENHFAAVTANALNVFNLTVGTYWLCVVNTGSIGGFAGGLSESNPLAQQGPLGSVVNVNGVAMSSNGGASYGLPDFTGSAMLMELYTVPEPSSAVLTLGTLAVAGYARRRALRARSAK